MTNRIYCLLGQTMHELQMMELYLASLLLLNHVSNNSSLSSISDLKNSAFDYWSKIDRETMGGKLRQVIKNEIFAGKSEIEVFEFIKNKRNYLVHDFFVVNDCSLKENVEKCEKELEEMRTWCSLLNKALKKMVQEAQSFDFNPFVLFS